MVGGPAQQGGMTPPMAGEFRRFPFFDEQKADPGYPEVMGDIFSASITRLRAKPWQDPKSFVRALW